MKQQLKNTMKLTTIIIFIIISTNVKAQIPPAGKYNTSNYPTERKAIEIVSSKMDTSQFLNDDLIAVGPEGKVSYGFEEWKKGFTDKNATFKSILPRPGTVILRVYNGDAAVKNMVMDVVFTTPGGDFSNTVVRTETYIKQNGRWYFVAGQGTKLATKEELDNMGKKQ